MKIRRILVPLLIIVPILLLAVPVQAQTNQPAKFVIPFTWHAGNAQMDPGTYYVSYMNYGIVHITNRDKVSILIQHLPRGYVEPLLGRLTFRKYGSNYFLAKVAIIDSECEFTMTKTERDYIVKTKPDTAIVLAEVR